MIRSSASLMAEDVTVRCRVRRSVHSHNFESSGVEGQEMVCTMRNWEGPTSSSRLKAGVYESFSLAARTNNAELLLTSIEYRDDYIPTKTQQNSIPVGDIVVVQKHRCGTKLGVTTISSGYYEFGNLTANGHDILLAFLQASLRPERISISNSDSYQENLKSNSSSVGSCLDFDTVQARYVHKRTAAETWPEKLSRRFGHVVSNLTELCDVACCTAEREAPPSTTPRDYFWGMDMGEDATPRRRRQSSPPPGSPNRLYHLPSGLSVEPEPESTY